MAFGAPGMPSVRATGITDQEVHDRIIQKYSNPGSDEEVEGQEPDAVELMWRNNEKHNLIVTYMQLREKCLKGLKKGLKTKSYFILEYFIDFITLDKLNSYDIKYYHKWIKQCVLTPANKDFKKSQAYLKIKNIFKNYKDANDSVKSVLPLLLRQAGIKPSNK